MNLAKNGKVYEYYRCAKTAGKPSCKGQSVEGERVTAAISALVERLAGLAMTVRRFIPGEDHAEQLNHVTVAMRDLCEEKRRNLFDYPGGDDEYSEALEVLVDERRRLAALPQRPSAWAEAETGQTFAGLGPAPTRNTAAGPPRPQSPPLHATHHLRLVPTRRTPSTRTAAGALWKFDVGR
ncbi:MULTISPECIES: zinc ribbon domain-containing protein [Streptomycetaceae]|uniref:zinc ribbon domain-containing protein n=1 Tax=Streptomycetaceae TaxID=2062 RepID=UPI000AC06A87|nr:zinc ribbon domain-containing protein [Streptomyces sp. CB02056]